MNSLNQNLGLLLLRLAGGGVLLFEGFLKAFINKPQDVVNYFSGLGFPSPYLFASFISALEIIVGAFLILGVSAKFAAALGFVEMLSATLIVNVPAGLAAAGEVTALLAFIFLALVFLGPGNISLRGKFLRSKNEAEDEGKLRRRQTSSHFLLIIPMFIFLIFSSVFAAGGGGGGGGAETPPPPVCTQDIWTCADWSVCSIDKLQTRSCSLTSNCPTAETPKPEESRSCVPSCTEDVFSCSAWSACSASGEQARSCALTSDCSLVKTPKPIEKQKCQPACVNDVWSCTDFGSCKEDGIQARTCSLSFDCPSANTPKPSESKSCTPPCSEDEYNCSAWSQCQEDGGEKRSCALSRDCKGVSTPLPETSRDCLGLRCGQQAGLEERINCRLKLSNEELKQEFSILYFPEYCKAYKTKQEKDDCIVFYQSIGPCWKTNPGPERKACAYSAIGLKALSEEKQKCSALAGVQKNNCVKDLRKRVEDTAVFHMYELSVQAESLMSFRKVKTEDVANLETFIENKKQEFAKAKTLKEWKEILISVKSKWENFKKIF